jgi:hypothetical protein
MPLNKETKRILNTLIIERKDILYKSIAVRRRTKSLYPKALGKPI